MISFRSAADGLLWASSFLEHQEFARRFLCREQSPDYSVDDAISDVLLDLAEEWRFDPELVLCRDDFVLRVGRRLRRVSRRRLHRRLSLDIFDFRFVADVSCESVASQWAERAWAVVMAEVDSFSDFNRLIFGCWMDCLRDGLPVRETIMRSVNEGRWFELITQGHRRPASLSSVARVLFKQRERLWSALLREGLVSGSRDHLSPSCNPMR